MTFVADAGPLVTLGNADDSRFLNVFRLIEQEPGEVLVPAPVTAEVDYLLDARRGSGARAAFLDDLAAGRFRVVCLEPEEYETVRRLNERYADQNVGLADLSIVVIAHRFNTDRILTYDERHFRTLRPILGGSFTLLPGDV